ncbi:MAG: MBL fold metallo-hydrolase [Thermoplasmatota archaeon]
MARFGNRLTHRSPTLGDVWRLVREGGMRPPKKDRANARLVPRLSGARLPPEPAITWVGHATCVIQVAGKRLLTDPIWRLGLPARIPRLTPPGIAWEAVGPVDGVLISHNHYDHLDLPTLRRLPRTTPLFVPLGLASYLERRGFEEVHELDWWQKRSLGAVELTFVPTHHWSRRGLWDANRSLWGGWVVSAPGIEPILFAGDTGYGPSFAEVRRKLGAMGTAILPIGAYAPQWFMQPVHMNPEEAVRAASDVQARRMMGIHWGTFPLTREPILEPPERARAAWLRAGRASEDLWILALGEGRSLAP